MKKTAFALLIALSFAACADDPMAPSEDLSGLEQAAILGFAGSFTDDPGSRYLGNLQRLPENLKLTAEQRSRIDALLVAFKQATQVDAQALAAIAEQAKAAHAAGKTREEIRRILAQGDEIRRRLHDAEARLRAAIDAVLTPEQRAWLASQQQPCRSLALTEAQKTQIGALVAAFQEANQADLAAIRAAHEKARTAKAAGATREQIAAILDAVRPAMERVRAAEQALTAAIAAVLTPEQQTSGCFKIPSPPGGRK